MAIWPRKACAPVHDKCVTIKQRKCPERVVIVAAPSGPLLTAAPPAHAPLASGVVGAGVRCIVPFRAEYNKSHFCAAKPPSQAAVAGASRGYRGGVGDRPQQGSKAPRSPPHAELAAPSARVKGPPQGRCDPARTPSPHCLTPAITRAQRPSTLLQAPRRPGYTGPRRSAAGSWRKPRQPRSWRRWLTCAAHREDA